MGGGGGGEGKMTYRGNKSVRFLLFTPASCPLEILCSGHSVFVSPVSHERKRSGMFLNSRLEWYRDKMIYYSFFLEIFNIYVETAINQHALSRKILFS